MSRGPTRRLQTPNTFDPNLVTSFTFNEMAGAQKNLEVGPSLKPFQSQDGTGWTLDATTANRVMKGATIAIFNTSATVAYVRFGEESTVASGGAGSIDAFGNATIPCLGQQWTYLSSGNLDWIIASSATLLVYRIEDNTKIAE